MPKSSCVLPKYTYFEALEPLPFFIGNVICPNILYCKLEKKDRQKLLVIRKEYFWH